MTKITKIYRVDISKDVFDVMDEHGAHQKFSNDPGGFKSIFVSVVNPLQVKRFIQMKLFAQPTSHGLQKNQNCAEIEISI